MNLLTNFIFLIITFVTFLKLIFNNIKLAKYLILFDEKNLIDSRCKIYFTKKDLFEKNLYFCRCFSLNIGLKFYKSYKNLIFINAVEYFFGKKSLYLISFFIKFSKIKKLITIDDYRYIDFFSKLSKLNRIKSHGYMHGRFSVHLKIQKKLFQHEYDFYYVWSKYFKKKIIRHNKRYNDQNVFIKKPNYISNLNLKKINYKKKREINILFIEENSVPFSYFKNLYTRINKDKKIKLFYKFRPNDDLNYKKKDFLHRNKIEYFYKRNLLKVCKRENINLIIAFNSTFIIFAPLLNIFPVSIHSKYILKDYIDDSLVFVINEKKNISKQILKILNKKKELTHIRKKLWEQ